jgi:outer membrane protein
MIPLGKAWRPLLTALCFGTLAVSSPSPAAAQTNLGVTGGDSAAGAATNQLRILTLSDSIQFAVQHNFDIQIEAKGVAIAHHRLNEAYGIYDPILRSSVFRGHSLTPGGIDEQNRPYTGTTTDRDTVDATLGGLFPTGLEYEVGGEVGDSSGFGPDGPFENTGGAAVVRLRQPLLKDLWIDAPRLSLQVNRARLKISELAWRGQLMETVTRVELAFYDLLLARESVKVQEQALRLAEELLSGNRARIEQGVLAALDEKQAESQVSAQRSLLLSAQRNLRIQENVIKGLLSDNLANWADVAIQPAGDLTAVARRAQRQDSWEHGLAHRPDLLQAREEVERLGYIVRYNRNQIFPQLDVVGSYGHSASEREFSGTLGQVRRGSSPFHGYGLQLTLPLTKRSARESLKMSKAEREQSVLRLRQLEQEILLQIDDAVKIVETDYERVATTRQAREFAEVALQAEQTKMDNGKSTSFVVLQLQRDLTSARSEEIRALAEYNKALAQLALREGSVLERHKLQIDFRL